MKAFGFKSLSSRAAQALMATQHDHLEAIDVEVCFGTLSAIQRAGTVLAWAKFHQIDVATIEPDSLDAAVRAQHGTWGAGVSMPSDYLQLVFVIAAFVMASA